MKGLGLWFGLLSVASVAWAAEPATETAAEDAPWFVDRAADTGLDFVHWNGMSGRFYFPEVVGSGGALFDMDNDGDLDVYLVQGSFLGKAEDMGSAIFPPPKRSGDRLFRNELDSGRLRFTDVTAASGIDAPHYGMGVAVGDVDNDGLVDLYITNFGPNQLLKNLGGGRFQDITEAAGVAEPRWSVPASFFDLDADGWLDLYVGNYMDYGLARNKSCVGESGLRDYCGPQSYTAITDRLFWNRGQAPGTDGKAGVPRFDDISESSGITGTFGPTLGAISADFDGDGRLDLYVGNDLAANQLWLNRGPDGQGRVTFLDDALLLGAALNRDGVAEASMGIDAADFDGDGDTDLFMTHLTRESNTLYVNDGTGLFRDHSLEASLANESWQSTGFGTAFFDYDNDGWLDLLAVNGAVYLQFDEAKSGHPYPLHQPNQLFRNRGQNTDPDKAESTTAESITFEEVTASAGPAFNLSEVSRGALFGDIDNDGDTDVLVTNNSGPARLLLNQVGHTKPWLGLRLVAGEPARDQPGARVAVHLQGGRTLWRRVRTDGSYASASDPRILVGLGGQPPIERVDVHWLDGSVEKWKGLDTGRHHTLAKGTGSRD